MKKMILPFLAAAACTLFVGGFELLLETASAQGGERANTRAERNRTERKLAAEIRQLTERSDSGIARESIPGDGTSMNVDGRYQNLMLGKLDHAGEPIAACVTSLAEANRFFGKDLDTGERLPTAEYERDDVEAVAARHGMSKDEFLFYSRLAGEAVQMRVAASPQTATININNLDAAGEGFNDPTATAAEGGNNGITRGAQRLNLFNFAAGIWGTFLDSSVPITIDSNFDPIAGCTTSGGVLGSAGTINIHTDFTGSEFPSTWYHAALANKRRGLDLVPGNSEMRARFNSDVDTGCLGSGTRFYYGLDNTTPVGRINLLVVVLHEIGHGVGFSSFVNGSTGALNGGLADIYTRYMFDRTTGKYWFQMTDAERAASALNTNNVLWDGPSVKVASGFLTGGRDTFNGRVELFTPNPVQGGSSISHFSTAAETNLLMEPVINIGLPIDLDLTRQQMRDIGWFRDSTADQTADTISSVSVSGGVAVVGQTRTISWTNNGGFNRPVNIELSTDGGATFPTTVASNAANTGSFSWTVPNSPSTTARVRVREADFVSPSGASASNFIISTSPLAAGATISGRVVDRSGRSVSRATVVLTDSNGVSRTAISSSFGFFTFTDVRVGETYAANVRHKRFRFEQRVVSLAENLTGFDFVAE